MSAMQCSPSFPHHRGSKSTHPFLKALKEPMRSSGLVKRDFGPTFLGGMRSFWSTIPSPETFQAKLNS